MIELRWAVRPHTTTERPKLQYRIRAGEWPHASWGAWWDVPHVVVPDEPQGWVCSKCGTDRTKAACPNGYYAGVTGECPMVVLAQSA